jgi:hypothetical protein
MYDFAAALGALVLVGGAACCAGLVLFTDLDRFAGLVRFADFRAFFVILGLLETPKGPVGPLVRWLWRCIADGRELSGEQFRLLRGVVRSLISDQKGHEAFLNQQ